MSVVSLFKLEIYLPQNSRKQLVRFWLILVRIQQTIITMSHCSAIMFSIKLGMHSTALAN